MSFLKKLSQTLCSIFQKNSFNTCAKIQPEPYDKVLEEELIARFIFNSNYYSVQKGIVKFGAFLPNAKANNDASVMRITDLDENEIRNIDTQVVSRGDRISKGRAEFIAQDAFKLDLMIEIDTGPHPRHANLTNYSSVESQKRSQAQQLAEKAKLILRS